MTTRAPEVTDTRWSQGVLDGLPRGWVRRANGTFQSDRASEAPIAEATLRAWAAVVADVVCPDSADAGEIRAVNARSKGATT